MTSVFGDDQLERELRAVLHERAEDIAARARSAAEMTAEITPRVRPAGVWAPRRAALVRNAVLAMILLAVILAAIGIGFRSSRPPLHLLLAIDLPFQGEPGAPPIVDAVRLAIHSAHPPPGVTVDLPSDGIFDDAVDGSADPDRGAENMRRITADPRFVAVIGPYHSFVAEAEIPIANAAGLLMCSPTNTGPGLTLGAAAAAIRSRPDRPSYVRVATNDDAATAAAARLLIGVLGKRSVFVVSTAEPFAGGRSETFATEFEGLGGNLVARGAIGPGGDEPEAVAEQVKTSGADAVFYDGPGADGGQVLAALSTVAPEMPFVGLDIILDGPRSATGSFLAAAGVNIENAYGVFPAGTDQALGPQVQAAYQGAYGRPAESFILSGHACASVIFDAIDRLDASRLTGLADWREAIRAEVTAPGRAYRTAVGNIEFDANGDAQPQRVSIYRADANAGDWTFWQLLELPTGG